MLYLWLQKFPEDNKDWAPVKGGCFRISLRAENRSNLVPGPSIAGQPWSSTGPRCLCRRALRGHEGWVFNLPAGRFYLHHVVPSHYMMWAEFSIALASSDLLPSHSSGLEAIYCPQHSAATDKFCIACALMLNAVSNEPAERWSFTFDL